MKLDLSEKFGPLLEKIDEKNFYYIFGGILVFIFLLDYFVLMRPQLNSLSKITPEINLLKEDIDKAQGDMQRIEEYRTKVIKLQKDLKQSQKRVRPRTEVPLILERVSRIAKESKVTIDQMMPVTEDMELILENPSRDFYTIPITVEARSGYHNFGKFLNKLEEADVYLDADRFVLSTRKGSRAHRVDLTLLTIVYDEKSK